VTRKEVGLEILITLEIVCVCERETERACLMNKI